MATKDFTVFVIDLSPSMGDRNNGRMITDLEYGLKYFYDKVASSILKERKQDRIAIVLCHSPVTDNPHANADSLQKVQILFDNRTFTYQQLVKYSRSLIVNEMPIEENEGDCLEAMLVGIGLFKDTANYKFSRNIIVITNANSPINTFYSRIAAATVQAINNMDINVIVNGIDFFLDYPNKPTLKRENEEEWKKQIAEYDGKIINTTKANQSILYAPALKKVKPIPAFSGDLRFGADYEALANIADYSPSQDTSSICIGVQSFPAIKTEKLMSGAQYILNGTSVNKIKNETSYYVKNSKNKKKENVDTENEEDEEEDNIGEEVEYEKQEINKGEWDDGFKYSNMDLIAIDKDLSESSILHTQAGLDIMGFIEKRKLSFAYFTEESLYMVPAIGSSERNIISFNSLSQSLIDLETFALVRYVPKDDKEVQICTLMPTKFIINDTFTFGFILVRLAFKEDEKVGRFPLLTKVNTTNGESQTKEEKDANLDDDDNNEEIKEIPSNPLLPNENVNRLMEAFILAKDLDDKNVIENEDYKVSIKNPKLSLIDTESVQLPKTLDSDTDSKLLPSSPAIQKFSLKLKKIIIKSLRANNIYDYLNDKDFIEKNLIDNDEDSYEALNGKKSTNLFNLSNILEVNTSGTDAWLTGISASSTKYAKELIKELDIKYISNDTESDNKRRKVDNNELDNLFNKNKKPNYGQSEGEYDKVLDLDDLLC